jgi:hypothetical protein
MVPVKIPFAFEIQTYYKLSIDNNNLNENSEVLDEQSNEDKITLSPEEMKEVKERFGEIHCWIFKNRNGKYYIRTSRVRSKLYDSIQDIPKDVVESISHK